MARCGCSGAAPCSCFIEAGPGITVEGSGSPSTPYVISVDSGAIEVNDTPTINMSITGSGTGGDPFIIFGSVKLDPSGANLLSATANGLILTCSTVQACVGGLVMVDDTSTVDLSITGDGTAGNEYHISAVVKLSATAGNLLTADGTGLYLSCAQVRGCLIAGDGIAYNSTTGEISVKISTDGGNTAAIGTDGGVYVPPGSAVFTDCGITGDGTGGSPIAVDTGGAVWPFACADTSGAAVYCSSDGALRVDPEKFFIEDSLSISHGSGQTTSFGATLGGGPTDVGGPVSTTINNPSTCRDMKVIVTSGPEHARVAYSGTGANEITLGTHFVVSGDVTDDVDQAGHQRWRYGGGTTITFDSQRAASRRVYTIPAGGSISISLVGSLDVLAYNGTASINNWTSYLDVIGFSI